MKVFRTILMALMLIASVPLFQIKAAELTEDYSSLLTGQWRVSKVNFHSSPVDNQNKFSSYFMHQGIVRYDFKANNEFTYVVPNKQKNRPEDGRYWLWNTEGKNKFSINQISPTSPPFNFGLTAKIVEVKEYDKHTDIIIEVIFHADQQTATLTLTDLNDINWDTAPVVYVNNVKI